MRTLSLLLTAGLASLALAQTAPGTELVGFAVLPADTFASGPASGAFRETPSFRATTAPFIGQPCRASARFSLALRVATG